MSAERWRQLRALYDQVLDAPASDRARVLEAVAASHPELHQELIALIGADAAPDSLLDSPVARFLAPALSPGDTLCGRFVIERHIGSGGMGDVWAALDSVRDARVALKTIRPGLAHDERLWSRFKREIQLASQVTHPNVCRVHELFEDQGVEPPRLFFTMELLDGETLAARIQRTGALPVSEALQIVRDVCAGLDAAHEAGVIHRDLKPANIMLTRRGDSVRVVITDFGLARPDAVSPDGGADGSMAGMLMGTPAYMAPEQVRGLIAVRATDVYAAGLLLFEMLRGEPPFRGISTLDSWMRRAREGPEPLAHVVPGVTAAIDDVLRRCLQYEPDRRFQTPSALVAALDRRPLPGRKTFAAVSAALVLVAAGIGWNLRPQTLPREAQQWYDEAQAAVAEGAAVRARNAMSHVLSAVPGFPPAHALLAEVHLELDMPAEAVEDMARASQLVADGARLSSTDRLYVTGMHALALRECDAAVTVLRTRASKNDAARAYRMVTAARAMERCNRPDDALALLAQAAKVDARNAAVPLRTSRTAGRRRRYDDAFSALRTAETLFRDRNNAEGRGEVLLLRGTLLAEQDRLDDASAALNAALDLASGLMDERQQLRVLLQQIIVVRKRGDLARATSLAGEALARAQRSEFEPVVIDALFTSANVELVQRHYDKAEALLQDALRLAQRQRNEDAVAGARIRLATVFVPAGQYAKAEQELSAARPFYVATRDTRNIGKVDALSGQLALNVGDYPGAAAAFQSQFDSASKEGDPEEAIRARSDLASALSLAGWYTRALADFGAAETYYRSTKQPVLEAYARLNRLDTLSRLGRFDAGEEFTRAATLAPASAPVQRYALQVRAQDALRRGEPMQALTIAEEAHRSGQTAMWIDLAMCLAAARLQQFGVSRDACNRAVAAVGGQASSARWLETQLIVAEAHLWLNDAVTTRQLLAGASVALGTRKESEDKWYYAALMAASAPRDRWPAVGETLTRELDQVRLKLGAGYDGWSQRADVRALLNRSDIKEKMRHG